MRKLNYRELTDHFHDSGVKRECEVCCQTEPCLRVYDLDHDESLLVCQDCAKTDFVFFHNGSYVMSDKEE